VQFGLRKLLPENVEVRSGPGCPVCVTSPSEIDLAINLSTRPGVVVTSFGDMLRVPSTAGSLAEARARGGSIKIVYGIHDAVEMARSDPSHEYVHFGIGFETTAPMTAAEIAGGPPNNFSMICSHRVIPPVMKYLLTRGETRLDGFICPGHVSTIIGVKPYRELSRAFNIPQVIAGFEPLDVLMAIYMLIKQAREGSSKVENEYARSVRENGNRKALELMEAVFVRRSSAWRGIGTIAESGLTLRGDLDRFNAIEKFDLNFEESYSIPAGCKCGEVLRGIVYPEECPLFNKVCTLTHPVGPCAVSREGACYIAMRFGGRGRNLH
jgi:hydrogenase expression/formation protein HypD